METLLCLIVPPLSEMPWVAVRDTGSPLHQKLICGTTSMQTTALLLWLKARRGELLFSPLPFGEGRDGVRAGFCRSLKGWVQWLLSKPLPSAVSWARFSSCKQTPGAFKTLQHKFLADISSSLIPFKLFHWQFKFFKLVDYWLLLIANCYW